MQLDILPMSIIFILNLRWGEDGLHSFGRKNSYKYSEFLKNTKTDKQWGIIKL